LFKSIRQIIEILDKSSKQRLALIFFPMALTTLLELFSIALILPFMQVTVLGEINYGPARAIIDYLPEMELEQLGLWVAVIFGVIFITKNVFLLGTMYIVNATINYITGVYTTKLFQIYLYRPLVFYFANNSAFLLRNLYPGVSHMMEAAKVSLLMVFDAMVILAIVILLFFTEPLITIFATLFLTIIACLYYIIFSPIFRNWGEQSLNLEGSRNKWMLQSLSGIRDVKVSHSIRYLVSKIYDICRQYAKVYSRTSTAMHIPRLLIETSVVIGFITVVSVHLSLGQSKNEIVTIMGLFGVAALRIMPSLNRFLSSVSELRRLDSYIQTIYQAFSAGKDEYTHPKVADQNEEIRFNNQIEIVDVSYTYPGTQIPAISHLSIKIKKGEVVGIVGASGSGKSTLMDIVLGLLEPDSGQLLVDGRNVFDNVEGWQKKCGFVPQEIFLLDDTIRRNVAFAIEDSEIDDSRLLNVLTMTKLDEFTRKLPDGFNTVLGERGAKLSGGQRQRLVIARAFYRDPDVLVFDEATSALDNMVEYEIYETLSNFGGKTIIIVAHRLSTVRNCDKIIFMKNGGIVSVDTFDRLMTENAEFKEFALAGYDGNPIDLPPQ
jgi:ABC-type multidrug transport system fused ATPase/permease subunit